MSAEPSCCPRIGHLGSYVTGVHLNQTVDTLEPIVGLCLLATAPGGMPKLTGRGPEPGQACGQPELPESPQMAQDRESRSL